MGVLASSMPPLAIQQKDLATWGASWLSATNSASGKSKNANAFDKGQGINFASFIDQSFASSLAMMLGGIDIVVANGRSLLPTKPDCVETGSVRIIGGV